MELLFVGCLVEVEVPSENLIGALTRDDLIVVRDIRNIGVLALIVVTSYVSV